MRELHEAIRTADTAYHRDDTPEITDPEYDALVRREQAVAAAFPDLAKTSARSERRRPLTSRPCVTSRLC